MRVFLVSVALAASALVACGGTAEPGTGSGEADVTEQWSAKLSCDNGAAVLDADRTSPRSLQFVVREPAITKFLSSKVNHLENVRGEIIVRGASDRDVTDGASFSRFVDDALHFDASSNFNGTVTTRVLAEVKREDGDHVRLTFSEVTTTRSCSGHIDDHNCVNGTWSQADAVRELANWGFQSCR
jgi:hypothetical protein